MNRFVHPLAISLFLATSFFACKKENKNKNSDIERVETVYSEQKIELDTDGDGKVDMTVGVSDNNLNVETAPGGGALFVDKDGYGGQKYCYMDAGYNCDDIGGLYAVSSAVNGSMDAIFGEYSSDQALQGDLEGNPEKDDVNGIQGGGDGFSDETGEPIKGYQGICPDGWHIPSDAEWIVLEKGLGMAAGDAFKYGPEHDRGAEVNLRNQFIQKLGLGYDGYYASNGEFAQKGEAGVFASSTPVKKNGKLYLIARQIDTLSHQGVVRTLVEPKTAISIRCFKD